MDGWAWLVLDDIADLGLILSAIGDTCLVERVREWEVAAPFRSDDTFHWRYHLGPYPADEDDPSGEWWFEVTLEFPPSDIPDVLAAVRAAVKSRGMNV